eukprot:452543_1
MAGNIDLMPELDSIEIYSDAERVSMLSLDNDEFFSMKPTLKTYIDQINNNAQLVNEYSNNYKIASSNSEYRTIQDNMDHVMDKNSNITLIVRSLITEQKNKICETENSVKSLKVIEFNNLVETFRKTTINFHQSLNNFNEAVRNKQMRQIKFLNNGLNDNEIQTLNEYNYEQRQQWIEETMQLTDDKTLARLVELEDQRDGMLKIEQSICELKQLFEDLNILIVDQGLLIDNIENNVEYAGEQVIQAVSQINKADKHQQQSRKLKCWCLLFLLVIIVVIICYFVFKDQIF